MSGPPSTLLLVRQALRLALVDVPVGAPVAAAVSGGADSLALAAGLAAERPGAGVALVVDHGLQPGSERVAADAATACAGLGLEARVLDGRALAAPHPGRPDAPATSGHGGPEGRARGLRHALLQRASDDLGGAPVLLGHTRDDQAEQVVLGLARGAGARSLAGMPARRGRLRRPLLGLPRSVTRAVCADLGLVPWDDPHNDDERFARVRVRRRLLPLWEELLGPGVGEALVRSAAQLREDADALEGWARAVRTDEVAALAALPAAVRARALKGWAEEACGRSLTAAHVRALRALVEDWHGQGPVGLPGGGSVVRTGGRLAFAP